MSTERPFQIVGVDIMKVPITSRSNHYVILCYKCMPVVLPTTDSMYCYGRTSSPEVLLSYRGTNLLSFLVKVV